MIELQSRQGVNEIKYSKENVNYKTGIYVRESRDENGENYETIDTQKELLIDFVGKNKLGTICGIYIDDNVSGSGFEREGIKRIKQDVEAGRIDLLVLKDLSRLGRNNAKTLLFLDFLEEFGVRVITFDGRYDSLKDNDTVGIDTWYNERYIRDISKKIRTNLRFKIEKGEYIGRAPYGYIKSEKLKNKLVIDDTAARVIREIFDLYMKGYGCSYISKHLDSKGYPPPASKHSSSTANLWSPVAIQRILSNRVYAGDTVQGISEKVSFKSKKTRRIPQDRWVITADTHEAIICKEAFDEVQRLKDRKCRRNISCGKEKHLLAGILYCGRCGSMMYARARENRPMAYICGNYAIKGKKVCASHHIKENDLFNIIIEEIRDLLKKSEMHADILNFLEGSFQCKEEIRSSIAKLEQQLSIKQRQQDALYMDKLEGRISEQLFLRTNSSIENRIAELKCEIEKIAVKMNETPDSKGLLEKARTNLDRYGITAELVMNTVDRIIVYDAGDCTDGSNLPLLNDEQKKNAYEKGAIIINFGSCRSEEI